MKKQIVKLIPDACINYEPIYLLAPKTTIYYLHQLDIQVCRLLKKEFKLEGEDLKYAAYLFVTYAIEVRADKLYPIYQDVLTAHQQKVMVKSIIVEEEGHLEEMISQLKEFHSEWEIYANQVIQLEETLFAHWISAIENELNNVEIF